MRGFTETHRLVDGVRDEDLLLRLFRALRALSSLAFRASLLRCSCAPHLHAVRIPYTRRLQRQRALFSSCRRPFFGCPRSTGYLTAALRHCADPERLVPSALAIDYHKRRVSVVGRAVELIPTKYVLVWALSLNAGRVTTYTSLYAKIWR